MNPNGQKQLTKEEQEARKRAVARAMAEIFTLSFTREELLAIHNLIAQSPFKFADAIKFKPIVDKLEPITTVAPDIEALTQEELKNAPKENPSLIGVKEDKIVN